MNFTKSLLAVATASLLALAPLSSNASLILTIDDLATVGTDVTLADGALNDFAAMGGVVTFVGAAGTWMLSVTTGQSVGVTSNWALDLNTISISSVGGGTLRVSLTETDLTYGSGSGPLSISSNIGGTSFGTVSYASYADDGNTAFGKSTLLFSGSATPGGGAFADGNSAQFSRTDPFSLTLTADITHRGSATTSFDFDAHVPEPGTLALLSVALLGAGAATRRRRG